ncbi:uncharacterized protein LOC111410337 isoform X2 [Olea europaea var. sylvestris]|uniref:uncharacterized protein LOC111410337 isoform X2 n=1 Tax=Olea europaea var. sylvestris TaxID=158386 RepID=UPI000C1D7D7A|nr:uncharacterized protein LOC111410337 isoform X2 [Olea europaea var. sylvestris]
MSFLRKIILRKAHKKRGQKNLKRKSVLLEGNEDYNRPTRAESIYTTQEFLELRAEVNDLNAELEELASEVREACAELDEEDAEKDAAIEKLYAEYEEVECEMQADIRRMKELWTLYEDMLKKRKAAFRKRIGFIDDGDVTESEGQIS